MALTSLVLGIALVVLIAQLAILINLLQNEIRPILDSTTETVNTLKGTTQFLSNNLTEPVIKLNEYLAMFKRIIKPSKK
jgi:predicted PurR-regulated permease PerM